MRLLRGLAQGRQLCLTRLNISAGHITAAFLTNALMSVECLSPPTVGFSAFVRQRRVKAALPLRSKGAIYPILCRC